MLDVVGFHRSRVKHLPARLQMPASQAGRRGFDPRLPLLFFKSLALPGSQPFPLVSDKEKSKLYCVLKRPLTWTILSRYLPKVAPDTLNGSRGLTGITRSAETN